MGIFTYEHTGENVMSKVARDAVLAYFEYLAEQHDCNDCYNKDCGYAPKWGEPTRVNCPHWKGENNT